MTSKAAIFAIPVAYGEVCVIRFVGAIPDEKAVKVAISEKA